MWFNPQVSSSNIFKTHHTIGRNTHEMFTPRPLLTGVVSIFTKTMRLTSQKVKNLTDYSYIGGEELKIQLARDRFIIVFKQAQCLKSLKVTYASKLLRNEEHL